MRSATSCERVYETLAREELFPAHHTERRARSKNVIERTLWQVSTSLKVARLSLIGRKRLLLRCGPEVAEMPDRGSQPCISEVQQR